jgi:hypothetical protein
MKCPKCDASQLEEVCWVPDDDGAFVILECRSCDVIYRRERRAESGRYRAPAKAEAMPTMPSSEKPTWRPPRLRSA